LTEVATRPIEIPVTVRDFDDYWESNTGFTSPFGIFVKSLPNDGRARLQQLVKARLHTDKNGVISYTARVNAVRGQA